LIETAWPVRLTVPNSNPHQQNGEKLGRSISGIARLTIRAIRPEGWESQVIV
jgi:hypothetical protein